MEAEIANPSQGWAMNEKNVFYGDFVRQGYPGAWVLRNFF
ncbi:MAG: hypothetical protein HW380_2085 [Magnetococcales bacterium]|nr:hypothetical protein [Magnetococcales bacterium]